MIRLATDADAPAIAAIWNAIIRDTTITFTTIEKTSQSVRQLMTQKASAGFPMLVVDNPAGVEGFGTFDQFRAGPGYRHTFEHTVYLASKAQGRGVGRAMVCRLEELAVKVGGHVMVAGISGENSGGIAFHTALGYREVARMPELGRKFGRWLDLVLMQKRLEPK